MTQGYQNCVFQSPDPLVTLNKDHNQYNHQWHVLWSDLMKVKVAAVLYMTGTMSVWSTWKFRPCISASENAIKW